LISGFGVPVMLGVQAAMAVVTEHQALRLFKKKRRSTEEHGPLFDAAPCEDQAGD
jgi:hypothetical protein